MSRRLQDIALVALGVLAAILVFLALRGVSTDSPTTTVGGATPPGAPVAGGAGPGEDGAVDGQADDSGATADTSAATQDAPADPLEVARAALASDEPLVISALGDSTSNTRQEWVHLWAEDLATTRPVTISHWNERTEDGFVEADVLSTSGANSPITIWSGSQGGATAAYAVDRLTTIIPEAPDLVLLNYGHNQSLGTAPTDFRDLLTALRTSFGQVPVVVVLQQPQADDANAQVRQLISDWARSEGLATIDVAAAFLDQGDFEDLLEDPVHPNGAGSRLWAQTVGVALAP